MGMACLPQSLGVSASIRTLVNFSKDCFHALENALKGQDSKVAYTCKHKGLEKGKTLVTYLHLKGFLVVLASYMAHYFHFTFPTLSPAW